MKKITHTFRYLDIVMVIFVALLLISNIVATKLIVVGPFIFDGGAILFPLTYIIGDILTEVYGYKKARRTIWIGFAVSALAALTFMVVQYLPSAPDWHNQAAYEAVIGFVPRIVLASMGGYLIGQFINSYVLAKLKVRTKGKKMWLRLVASTLFSELADTTVFCTIAFFGILQGWSFANYVVVGVSYKVAVEIICLPITYRVIGFLKRRENIDTYDKDTDFNPLRLDV